MTRTIPFVLVVLAVSSVTESAAQTPKEPNTQQSNEQRFMQRFEEIPNYRNSVEQLKRQAVFSRELEYRRNAGERIVPANTTDELVRGVHAEVTSYLQECRDRLGEKARDFGINHVIPNHLDFRRISLVPVKSKVTGQQLCRVVFDQAFHHQVLKRGRQLKLQRETNRFPTTLFTFAGVFAALCILYGVLKVLAARASEKHRDYITTSRISMV